jgi:glycyl-tRNA synthetase
MGWSEVEGIANRTDFDLTQHMKISGEDLQYFDTASDKHFVPYVIEPSGGVDRAVLACLFDAYREETVKGRKRIYLSLDKKLAPLKIAVLPLLKKMGEIVELCHKIRDDLKGDYRVVYDDTAAIGRLYRRQDEIGTPYCVTVDVDTLTDKKVTVRERDTMEQVRIDISNLVKYVKDNLGLD